MEQGQPDNVKENTSCAGSITEAYLIAASIHEKKKEVERFAKSKRLINKNSSHGRHIFRKTESTISKLESATLESKKRLKVLEKDIIEKVANKIRKTIESKNIVDESTISSNPFWDKESLELKQELEEIERIKKRIDKLEVDKLDNTKDIHSRVDRANNTINSLFESDNKVAKLDCDQNTLTLEKLLQKAKRASSKEFYKLLIDEVNHKILGTQQHGLVDHPVEKASIIKESVNNYLGEKLLSHVMDNRSDIYPERDERIKSLQVRDIVISKPKSNGINSSRLKKMLIKTKKMNRESDKMLLWCDTVLNSWSVKSVFRNLDYVNHLTKNHKQILDVVSDPWGDIKQSIKEKAEREKNLSKIDIIDSTPIEESTVGSPSTDTNLLNPLPPPEIRLYSEDKNLSATLATSLAEYTKQLYFSDLTQRVEELEKKIQ